MKGAFLFLTMIDWLEHNLLTCFFKSHFGIDCPGCGFQRAFIALLKGDVLQSLHLHAALIPFLLTLFVLILQLIKKYDNGGTWTMWCFIMTCAITITQYVFKQVMLWY